MSEKQIGAPKRVTIMGLGSYKNGSGISTALFFAKQGAEVLITDLKPPQEFKTQIKKLKKFKNVCFVFGRHREKDFQNTDLIFQNPCVPDNSPYIKIAKKNKIPIINDWSIFLQEHNNFLIGITGTKGKSTTTSLIYELIKTKHKNVLLCGNIGVSPLKYIHPVRGPLSKESGRNQGFLTSNGVGLKLEPPIVAELSSWLLRGFKPVKKSPDIAVVTNLLSDHLDKYSSLKAYYRDKENIFKFQKRQDYLILNKDNSEARKLAKKAKSKVYWFSKKQFSSGNGVYVKGRTIYFRQTRLNFSKNLGGQNKKVTKVCSVTDIKIIGEHNLENALAAITVALLYGISTAQIKTVLHRFKGIPHRLEFVRQVNGVKYYNDTTATSPEGAIAALMTFKSKKRKIILIAGGHDKNLDYTQLVKQINKTVKALILFKGAATNKILSALNRLPGYRFPVIEVAGMKQALKQAGKFAKKGDIVLLSPGAASFGIFKNEFDRGNQFIKLVKKL